MKKKILSIIIVAVLVGTSLTSVSTKAYGETKKDNMSTANDLGRNHYKNMGLSNSSIDLKSPSIDFVIGNTRNKIENNINTPKQIVNIQDENLKNALRGILGLSVDSDITTEDMESLVDIDLEGREIKSIEGLQYAINAETLSLRYNEIEDITPLSKLDKLQKLSLLGNNISDISGIKGVIGLNTLDIGYNPLDNSDIEVLKDLVNLTVLGLSNLKISDINPLGSLNKLENLKMYRCNLSDITPISNLSNLKEFYAPGNNIKDLDSLMSLKELYLLYLGENYIENIDALKELDNLKLLILDNNEISDITPLSNLSIYGLDLTANRINDLSTLSKMTNLSEVDIAGNQIVDISPLSNLNLNKLDLRANEVSDVSPLKEMSSLEDLLLDDNRVYDISPLKNLYNMNTFSAKEQQCVLADGRVGEGTKILIRDRDGDTPNILFESPGEYINDILTWSRPGVNLLFFDSQDGLFTGTISQIVL